MPPFRSITLSKVVDLHYFVFVLHKYGTQKRCYCVLFYFLEKILTDNMVWEHFKFMRLIEMFSLLFFFELRDCLVFLDLLGLL